MRQYDMPIGTGADTDTDLIIWIKYTVDHDVTDPQ